MKLTSEDLHDISEKSNNVISDLGPELRWLTSYVTDAVIDPSTGD